MQGIAPRVPVFVQMHEYAMKEIGANDTEFYSTSELDWKKDGYPGSSVGQERW
jgi:hypothetical protein